MYHTYIAVFLHRGLLMSYQGVRMLEPLCHPLQRVTGVANRLSRGYVCVRKWFLVLTFVPVLGTVLLLVFPVGR